MERCLSARTDPIQAAQGRRLNFPRRATGYRAEVQITGELGKRRRK